MGLSITHIVLLLVVVLVVFGVGKLPQVMGDLGKGVKNFKSGLNDDGRAAGQGDADARSDPPSSRLTGRPEEMAPDLDAKFAEDTSVPREKQPKAF